MYHVRHCKTQDRRIDQVLTQDCSDNQVATLRGLGETRSASYVSAVAEARLALKQSIVQIACLGLTTPRAMTTSTAPS